MFARKNHLMYLLAGNFFSGTHSGYAVMMSMNMLTAQPTITRLTDTHMALKNRLSLRILP